MSHMTKRPAKLRTPGKKPAPPLHRTSPLVLCDHLISLAQEADRAGYKTTAGQLVALVNRVFDEPRAGR